MFYSLATRDFGPWKRLHLVPGLLLFFALTAPWFILVSRANPEFAEFFFIHEHVERFLTTEHNRAGPLYYFMPIFGFGITPWLFVWASNVRAQLARQRPRSRTDSTGAGSASSGRLFVFVFFSMSGSKLPSYILPEFPAIALLLGRELERIKPRTLWLLSIPQMLLSVGVPAVRAVRLSHLDRAHGRCGDARRACSSPTPRGSSSTGIVFVVGSIAAAWLFRRDTERAKTLGIIADRRLRPRRLPDRVRRPRSVQRRSARAAGLLRAAGNLPEAERMDPAAPVFQVGTYDQTFPFYLGRTTTVVEFRDELALGLDAEPQKGYPKYPRVDSRLEGASAGLRADEARHLRIPRRRKACRCVSS